MPLQPLEEEIGRYLQRLKQEHARKAPRRRPSAQAPVQQDLPAWAVQARQQVPTQTIQRQMPQQQLPQTIKQPPVEPIEQPEEVEWWEKPKELFEKNVLPEVGKAISRAPIIPEFLKWASPVFDFFQKVDEAWAATISSAASPTLEWEEGENILTHQMREYKEWNAPSYVKGILEITNPIDWFLFAGWGLKGAKALKAGRLSLKAVKPAKILTYAMGNALKMPTLNEFVESVASDPLRKLYYWTEHVPVIGQAVKLVGGPSAFIKKNIDLPEDFAKASAVYSKYVNDVGNNINNSRLVRLQASANGKTIEDVLGIGDDMVMKTATPLQKGLDNTFGNVLEHPKAFGYATEEAKDMVDQLHGVVDSWRGLMEGNGVKLPKHNPKYFADTYRYFPRNAEGMIDAMTGRISKLDPSNPFSHLTYELMSEGVAEGIIYKTDIMGVMDAFGRASARKIATTKLDDALKTISKKATEAWKETDIITPDFLKAWGLENTKLDILNKVKLRSRFLRPAAGRAVGKPIHGRILNQLRQYDMNNLADEILSAQTVKIMSGSKSIKAFSRELGKIYNINSDLFLKGVKELKHGNPEDIYKQLKLFIADDKAVRKEVTRFWAANAENQLTYARNGVRNAISKIDDALGSSVNAVKTKAVTVNKAKQLVIAQTRGPQSALTQIRNHSAVQGRLFPRAVAEVIEPIFADTGQAWLKSASQVSSASRTLTAAMDLSAPFIQGLAVFGRNPAAWVKATAKTFQSFLDPQTAIREVFSRETSILDRVMHGGTSGVVDFFEAMPALQKGAGKAGKVFGKTGERIGKSVVRETYGRAEVAFLTFGEIARDELWKSLKTTIRGVGADVAEKELRDLARSIDRMTGVMSTKALGIGISQRQAESAFVFFAPRYTRAGLALVGDVFKGGLTGSEARKALGGLALGGTSMYYAAAKMLGQAPNFDPTSSRFMTLEVGGRHVGFGGLQYAIMRLMAGITADTIGNIEEEGVGKGLLETAKQLSPLNVSRVDNELYKFWFSRAAPLTGTFVAAAVEHTNYLGEPFESPADYARYMGSKVLPISVQNLLPGEYQSWQGEVNIPMVAGVEFLGARQFPLSAWEMKDNARDALSQQKYGKQWDELNRAEKRVVEQGSVVIQELNDVIADFQERRGEPETVKYMRFKEQIEQVRDDRDARINLASEVLAKEQNYPEFRLYINDVNNDYAAQMDAVYGDSEYADMIAKWDEPVDDDVLSEQDRKDVVYDLYTDVIYGNKIIPQFGAMTNELGEPVWENRDKFKQYIHDTYGPEYLDYIENDVPLAGRDLPPAYFEMRKAMDILEPYWKVKSDIYKRFGEPKTQSQYNRLQRIITRMRERMIRSNREMAQAYDKYYRRTLP